MDREGIPASGPSLYSSPEVGKHNLQEKIKKKKSKYHKPSEQREEGDKCGRRERRDQMCKKIV